MKQTLVTLGIAAALAAPASHAQLFGKSVPDPVGIGADGDRDAAFKSLIDDGAALRHVPKPYSGPASKVALTSVSLEFVTETSVSATTKSFLDNKQSVSQDVTYRLMGVEPSAFQAIVDKFSDDLRAAIAARGYSLVDQNLVANANPDFAANVKKAETPSISKGFFSNSGSTGVAAKGTVYKTGFSMGFDSLNVAKTLGDDVIAMDTRLVINFAKLNNSTDFFSKFGNTIKVQVSHGLQSTLLDNQSRVTITSNLGAYPYPFLRVGILPGEVSKEVTSKGSSGGQITANVLTGLLTMGKSLNSSANYEATAVSNYQEVMSTDLKGVAEVIAAALQKK